jgi:hypothetical protein
MVMLSIKIDQSFILLFLYHRYNESTEVVELQLEATGNLFFFVYSVLLHIFIVILCKLATIQFTLAPKSESRLLPSTKCYNISTICEPCMDRLVTAFLVAGCMCIKPSSLTSAVLLIVIDKLKC